MRRKLCFSGLSLPKSILRNVAGAFTRPNMPCASSAGTPSYRRRPMDPTKSKKPIRSRRRGYVPFRIGVDRRIPSLQSSLRFSQRRTQSPATSQSSTNQLNLLFPVVVGLRTESCMKGNFTNLRIQRRTPVAREAPDRCQPLRNYPG
jgi:hypothetical protein